MATARPDDTRIMKATGRSRSPTRTDIAARGLALTIDEPPERDGDNAGLTPPETLLAALIGCTCRISHKIAEANGFEIQDMSVDVEAAFDRRGVNLEQEIEVPFATIDLTTDAGDAAVERLAADLGRFCPISKILRRSGTTITDVWTINGACAQSPENA